LSPGALDKEVFEDEPTFATVERSAAAAAGYLSAHCLWSRLGANDFVGNAAMRATEAR